MARSRKVRGMTVLLLVVASVSVTAEVARATTPTATPTPTQGHCVTTTPEPLYVDPVTSPTDELTQTIYVHTGNADRLEISSEAGTFLGEYPFDRVEVSLLPNTANHLRVTMHVRRIVEDGCTYGDYTLTTTSDLHGAPLTIVQGTTFGPTIAVEPPTTTVTCSADFEIKLRNVSEGEDVLEISFISLHHAYSQGDYGTDFTWDTSALELPLTLLPGQFVGIPVSYQGKGLFDSRMVLQVVSNARNNNSTQYLAYKGKRCPTPTPVTVEPPDTGFELPCIGDCDSSGVVTVDELLTGVGVVLGEIPLTRCQRLQSASIDAMVTAVGNALHGCSNARVREFRDFERFDFLRGPAFGFCPEYGSVLAATVRREQDGRYLLKTTVAERGVEGVDRCLIPGRFGGDCTLGRVLGCRTLSEDESALVRDALGAIRVWPEEAPDCGVIDPCLHVSLDWDDVRLSDDPCGSDRPLAAEIDRIAGFLDSLAADPMGECPVGLCQPGDVFLCNDGNDVDGDGCSADCKDEIAVGAPASE